MLLYTFKTQVEFTNAVDAQVSRVFMLIELNAYFKRFGRISPVEHTRFLREDLKRAEFLALGLDNVECMERSVYHQEAGLEANQL